MINLTEHEYVMLAYEIRELHFVTGQEANEDTMLLSVHILIADSGNEYVVFLN